MQSAPRLRSLKSIGRLLACVVGLWLCADRFVYAQIPVMNVGSDSSFGRLDFAQIYFDQLNRKTKESDRQRAQNQELIDSGVVSAFDVDAPNKALEEFNRAAALLKAQNSKEAIGHLQKAIAAYPKFVSAHISLGLAYFDLDDAERAKNEFDWAAKLDGKFPGSFLNLGLLALSLKDFGTAQLQLEKAASLRPNNAKILSALAFAQNGGHQYQRTLETTQRVHTLEHKGMANVHYIAAAAALELGDFTTVQRELGLFLSEDPTNPLAPTAHHNLDVLAHNREVTVQTAGDTPQRATTVVAYQRLQTFPNSERLKAELSALGDKPDGGTCDDCDTLAEVNASAAGSSSGAASDMPLGLSSGARGPWTIRRVVDEVALFFAVSSHGHMVSDLQQSDIEIRDDNKPPQKVLQFAPQSKLPLRLALLVDTSGSVHDRFSFEKHAATKFVQKLINSASDLGFVAGFSGETTVTQDFTAQPGELGSGIEKLANGGGTALFDAVSFACWKLAAYPDRERVARVLVVLSDGEDNSSHRSLKQSIQDAEATGVTIYTVSTREDSGPKTAADKILEVLAERSGGEAMFPVDMSSLSKSFDKLRDLIRSRYLVAYKPADFVPNGKYRTIHIVAEKDGKRLQVRARKGYHARLD